MPTRTPAPTPTRAAAPTPTPAPRPTAAPAPAPAPTRATPPPAAVPGLSLDDVKRLREQVEALRPGAAPPRDRATPANDLLTAVTDKLRETADADAARIEALERALASAEARADAAEKRIQALEVRAEEAGNEQSAALADALAAVEAVLGRTDTLDDERQALQAALDRSTTSLESAQRQISELKAAQQPPRDGHAVIGPETLATLLGQFVSGVGSQLGGLRVASGDVALKTAVAPLGDGAGFVLPGAGTKTQDLPVLHEIRLRLDPSGTRGT